MREPNLIDTYQGDNQKTFPCKKVLHLSKLYLENDAVFIYSNYFSLNIILLSSPSLSLYFSLFLSSGNVPHAYADNIQINMGDRRNETLLIISRVRLPRESDKCIILIGLLYMSFTIIK